MRFKIKEGYYSSLQPHPASNSLKKKASPLYLGLTEVF
jgi:hypothetical protein